MSVSHGAISYWRTMVSPARDEALGTVPEPYLFRLPAADRDRCAAVSASRSFRVFVRVSRKHR